jgi:hypothetical protein
MIISHAALATVHVASQQFASSAKGAPQISGCNARRDEANDTHLRRRKQQNLLAAGDKAAACTCLSRWRQRDGFAQIMSI